MANIVVAKYFNSSKVIQQAEMERNMKLSRLSAVEKRSLMQSEKLSSEEKRRIMRAKKISPGAERRAWMAVKERLLKEENKKMPILLYIR